MMPSLPSFPKAVVNAVKARLPKVTPDNLRLGILPFARIDFPLVGSVL